MCNGRLQNFTELKFMILRYAILQKSINQDKYVLKVENMGPHLSKFKDNFWPIMYPITVAV